MKITDYRVVEAVDIFHFNEVIKRMIAEGWQPLGGISIAIADKGSLNHGLVTTYAQAVVLYEIPGNT